MRIQLPGYARLTAPNGGGVALESCRAVLESILSTETIYDFASRQENARKLEGRAPVYAVELPDGCGAVVVRRSMRGGALARLNSDLFLPPTRGLRELLISLHLRAAGVPTPEVVAVVVYRAGPVFRRSDVVTRELSGGTDLALVLGQHGGNGLRSRALEEAAALVAALSKAGAHHPDLNLKNIFITGLGSGEEALRAHVLDIDRIRFHVPGDPIVLGANIERLERSLRKRRDLREIEITDEEILQLRARITEMAK